MESFQFALRGLVANRMRAVLTMLGIAIGVASVITLVAVGTGSQQAVDASYDKLGRDTLFVLPSAPGRNSTATHRTALTYPDLQALGDRTAVPDAVGVAPVLLMNNITTQFGTSSTRIGSLIGSTPEFLAIEDDDGRDRTRLHRRRLPRPAAGLPARQRGGRRPEPRRSGRPGRAAGAVERATVRGHRNPCPERVLRPMNLDDRAICTGSGVADALHGYTLPGQGPIDAIAVQPSSEDTLAATQQVGARFLDEGHHVLPTAADFQVTRAYWLARCRGRRNRR